MAWHGNTNFTPTLLNTFFYSPSPSFSLPISPLAPIVVSFLPLLSSLRGISELFPHEKTFPRAKTAITAASSHPRSPRSTPSPVLRRGSFPRRRSPMWPSLVRCPWNKSPPLPRQSSFPLASRLRQQREVAEKGPILPTSFCDGFQNSWASRVAVRLPILLSG